MENSPFFSVCVPNYNYGGYIKETIESILNQTFQDFEIIIVDNASTDDSWSVIQKIASVDKRIKIYRNNFNIGFAPNLQRATEVATGRYINLLSSDDIMYPEALQWYYDVIQQCDQKKIIIHSAFDIIDSKSKPYTACFRKPDEIAGYFSTADKASFEDDGRIDSHDSTEVLKHALLKKSGIAAFCTTIYAREIWEDVEGYDMNYLISPDKAFLIKALPVSERYIYINKRLFGYRVHNNNQISKSSKHAVLKLQVDGYIRSFSIPEDTLKKIGATRRQVEKFYIDFICLNFAFEAIKENSFRKSFRIFLFGLATYPGHLLLNRKSYLLLLGYCLSPILKGLLLIYRQFK